MYCYYMFLFFVGYIKCNFLSTMFFAENLVVTWLIAMASITFSKQNGVATK